MAAVITQDTNERSSLSSYMLISTYIAVLIIAVATIPLVSLFPTEQAGFSFTVTIYAILSLALFLICFAGTREKESLVKRKRHSLVSHLKLIPRNKYLLILISGVFFTAAAGEMQSTAAIYFFKYNIGDDSMFPIYMLVVVSMIFGAFLVPMLAKKMGSKRNLYILATLLLTVTRLGILVTPFENLGAIILLSALGSVGGGMIFVLIWSMIPDTVEYGEWKTGVRGEGIIYSTLTFTTKMAYAVGGALAGLLLSWAGYVPNIVQTPQTQKIILYMLALFPVISGILAILIMLFYKIDAKFYGELLREINERKGGIKTEIAIPAAGAVDA